MKAFSSVRVLAGLSLVVGLLAPASTLAETPSNAAISIEVGMISASDKGPSATAWFEREVAAFRLRYPQTAVVTTAVDRPRRFEVPLTQIPRLPKHVVGLASCSGYEIAYLAEAGSIVPIDNFLPDPEFDREAIPDSLWQPVRYAGKTWGVPWATECLLLACDWPLFEEAGIKVPPRTWDELIACADKLTRDTDHDGVVDQYGLRIGQMDTLAVLMITMLLQRGVTFVTPEGVHLDTAEAAPVFAFFQTLLKAPYHKSLREERQPNERYAMRFVNTKRLTDLEPLQRYRLAAVPTSGKDVNLNLGTFYLAVRRSQPREEAASWEFVKWFMRREVTLPESWTGFPCRRDVVERKEWQQRAAHGIQNAAQIWRENERLVDFGASNLIGRREALEALWAELIPAVEGSASIEEALVRGEAAANSLLTPIARPSATGLPFHD